MPSSTTSVMSTSGAPSLARASNACWCRPPVITSWPVRSRRLCARRADGVGLIVNHQDFHGGRVAGRTAARYSAGSVSGGGNCCSSERGRPARPATGGRNKGAPRNRDRCVRAARRAFRRGGSGAACRLAPPRRTACRRARRGACRRGAWRRPWAGVGRFEHFGLVARPVDGRGRDPGVIGLGVGEHDVLAVDQIVEIGEDADLRRVDGRAGPVLDHDLEHQFFLGVRVGHLVQMDVRDLEHRWFSPKGGPRGPPVPGCRRAWRRSAPGAACSRESAR